jgi:hypothetical protein
VRLHFLRKPTGRLGIRKRQRRSGWHRFHRDCKCAHRAALNPLLPGACLHHSNRPRLGAAGSRASRAVYTTNEALPSGLTRAQRCKSRSRQKTAAHGITEYCLLSDLLVCSG